jgi:predicted RNase H-like HicB family nuclease
MDRAVFDKLDDGTFSGTIPDCLGVIAFAATLRACERELRSVLEDWILLGIKLGHTLPVIADIDLNRKPERDLEILNRNAEALNREVEDVLRYQAEP